MDVGGILLPFMIVRNSEYVNEIFSYELFFGSGALSMKCKDGCVATALTSTNCAKQRCPNFMAATLPLATSRICGFLGAVLTWIVSPSALTSCEYAISYSRDANNILIQDSHSISTYMLTSISTCNKTSTRIDNTLRVPTEFAKVATKKYIPKRFFKDLELKFKVK
jgi:hypothetical protein